MGQPALLYNIPERWRQNRAVLDMLGSAMAHLTANPGNPDSPAAAAHQGLCGCVAAHPPVYLTEDDAARVLRLAPGAAERL
jgi:hypothetical protein